MTYITSDVGGSHEQRGGIAAASAANPACSRDATRARDFRAITFEGRAVLRINSRVAREIPRVRRKAAAPRLPKSTAARVLFTVCGMAFVMRLERERRE